MVCEKTHNSMPGAWYGVHGWILACELNVQAGQLLSGSGLGLPALPPTVMYM